MKTFYAVNLNQKLHTLSRWALYFQGKDGMENLWAKIIPPTNVQDEIKYTLLPGMVFYPRRANAPDRFPAYHFVVKGHGMNHLDDLADTLARHYREDVEILHLHGYYPTRHHMPFTDYKTKGEKV